MRSIQETAEALGVARVTVTKSWRTARAWLASELGGDDTSDHGGSGAPHLRRFAFFRRATLGGSPAVAPETGRPVST